MVIELTDGLAQYKDEHVNALKICLSNLLLGYYESNLILIASVALCRFIKDRKLIEGQRQLSALNYLQSRNNFIPNVLWRFKVVLDQPVITNHELSIDFFKTTESIQPASFLCENLDDIRFYIKEARCFYPDCQMAFQNQQGGGDTTYDVFKLLIKRNSFCLVIVDSDIKYPDCPMGRTAARFNDNYKKNLTNIVVKILPVHEAENLVPFSFMKSHSQSTGFTFIRKLEKRGLLGQMVYYDVKNGIIKSKTEEDAQYKEYARDLYTIVYPHNRNGFDAFYAHKQNTDYLFPKINDNLLSDFIDNNSTIYNGDEFDVFRKEIADLVCTFMCCREKDPIL